MVIPIMISNYYILGKPKPVSCSKCDLGDLKRNRDSGQAGAIPVVFGLEK
jgi:hypothetical protein